MVGWMGPPVFVSFRIIATLEVREPPNSIKVSSEDLEEYYKSNEFPLLEKPFFTKLGNSLTSLKKKLFNMAKTYLQV